MRSITNEKAFEELIEQCLLKSGGYVKGDPAKFNRGLAMDTVVLLQFIQATQKNVWDELVKIHGIDAEPKFLYRLNQELETRGMLDCLRNGIIDYGKKFKLAFFKPVSGLNPETQELYGKNVLTVTRQVRYSTKDESSIDMLLSLNGLPMATIELKNAFTGQNVNNAKQQYKYDRNAQELLFQFKKRALVHFAVDTDEVYMTTRLQGSKTRYLPFNRGVNKGAGNPIIEGKHKTHYLWEEVFVKDSWMDILARFVHLQIEDFLIEGKKVKKEKMIFPRYHQLDVVRKIASHSLANGAGENYLIQHSAGSGKSNSIAWLSYHLASLHGKTDERVFDSVIVVTDRLVLDQQLQDTIYQFEHKRGVVERIDKDSQQLADALSGGTNIIITTLQKFPFVLDKVKELPKRNYAVIVDEAHSSQGGEMASDLKKILMLRDEEDVEDGLREMMHARGPQSNVSYFAFTATPKAKTIEMFGQKDDDGKPQPFHLYSMRQAIEEGFILDVLQNYMSYKIFFQLSKKIEEDPAVNKKKAAQAIARFLTLHPHNLAQKTEIIIEHFRQVTMRKIGGKAKAMVVTASREHVVRYKQGFDRYLKEKGYSGIKALVAFSGKVLLDGIPPEYTEVKMNNCGEKELPEKFSTSEYQLLLVAEKYQTGFDQPLLHTMYVDKRLDGVKAVQALSRLNRMHPGKDDTFVLDFVNQREDILNAFQPYYERTTLVDTTDPNKLYDLKNKIDTFKVIDYGDVDVFSSVFFKDKKLHNKTEHAQLNALVDKAVERYEAIEKEEDREDLANTCRVFTRLYAFLAQIMPFSDVELEKFYAYIRLFLKKLPKRTNDGRFTLDDEVALEYYRLQKIAEGKIELQKGVDAGLKPVNEAGTKKDKEEYKRLSEIIKIINDHFGTDFTEADKLFFDQIEEELVLDEKLGLQAKNNTIENFKYGFEDIFVSKLVDRMDQNEDLFNKIMEDKAFAAVVKDYLLKKVYQRLNVRSGVVEEAESFLRDLVSDEAITPAQRKTHVRVCSLEAMATSFQEQRRPEVIGWKEMKGVFKLNKDMFIAQVVGKSMEPTLKDGSWCLFRPDQGGSRNNKIVLVESEYITDSETMKNYTIKRYFSKKTDGEDEDSFRHTKIILKPDNKEFPDIILPEETREDEFHVVAEFVKVVG